MPSQVEWIRNICLSLPHTTEQVQWGSNLLFKIGGKMYAIVQLEPGKYWISFKCTEEDFNSLIDRPGVVPAPYLARAHWVAFEHDAQIPAREVEKLIRLAYQTVFAKLPKKLRDQLK